MLFFKFHIFIFNSLVTAVLMESRMKTDKSSKNYSYNRDLQNYRIFKNCVRLRKNIATERSFHP